jgi:hypothetical protein
MKTFKNGPLADWKQIEAGQMIPFLSNKARRVKFQIIANSQIEVWVGTDENLTDGKLQAEGSGKASVEYTHVGNSYVMIKAEKKSAVYINVPDIDQTVEESEKPSFTSIEPRVRNNTDVDRMMQLLKYNQQQNEAMLAKERENMRAEMAKRFAEQPKAETVTEEAPADDSGAETTS